MTKGLSIDSVRLCTCAHIEDKQRVFCSHDFRWTVIGDFGGFFVPPQVTTWSPGDLASSTLKDQDVFDAWAFLECSVHYRFGGNGFPTSAAFVARKEDPGPAVKNAVTKRFRTKSGEDNGVDSANTGTGKECGDGLPSHGQVYGNGISLLDAEALENVRDRTNFAKKFGIRDEATLTRFISLINDGSLKESMVNLRYLAK